MIVLSCSNLSKTYIVDTILDDISFIVENGDKIGVIGLNGSGKTTLFNILSGIDSQDSGDIYIQKDLKIGYLKQHVKVESDNTLLDECLEIFTPLIKMEEDLRYLEQEISLESAKGETERLTNLMNQYGHLSEKFSSLNGYGYKSEIKGVLKGLGFDDEDLEKGVNVLSGGQKARLSLAKLLLEKPDLLLLDEPTNHLDINAIDWLEKFLREYKGAALIISHDRYFLDNVVSKIFHIENLKMSIYNTNYTKFMDQRKKDLEILKKKFEDQQKEIKRQEEIIKRFMNYGGSRYIKQAQSRQKMLDKMKVLNKPMDGSKKTKITFEPNIKSGREVLKVENLEKNFGDFKLLSDINFNVYRGEKVGLIGTNGIGKTTLFKMILGEIPQDGGNINIGHHVFTGYFDQEMKKLNLNKTIIDEIWDDNPNMDHYEIRTMLSRFLFVGDDIFKEISDLSGGEKGRISLLKLMLSNSNFLLMDEPTNHLDIDSKEILEEAILNYEGTLFVISHDRYFLNRVTDKILELTKDGIKEYLGNYNYYLEKKNELIYEEDEDGKTKTQIKLERKREKEVLQKEKKKRKEIIELENKISVIETEIEKLDTLLCDPELYDNPDKVLQLSKERESLQLNLDELYDEWICITDE